MVELVAERTMANLNVVNPPPPRRAARGTHAEVLGDHHYPNQHTQQRHRNSNSTSFSSSSANTTSSFSSPASRSYLKPHASTASSLNHSRSATDSLNRPSLLHLDSTSTLPPRNQAPGISDRRKSSSTSIRASKRQSGLSHVSSSLRSRTLAPMHEDHTKDDSMGDTSGAETFEDAHEATNRLSTADSDTQPNGHDLKQSMAKAAKEEPKSKHSMNTEEHEEDDAVYQASAEASKQHSRDTTMDSTPEFQDTLSNTASSQKPLPINTRDRSISPSKISPGQKSPKKLTGDLASGAPGAAIFPPPSSISEKTPQIERTTSGSPTPSSAPGFARKASAGFAGFLGRMGRKQTRSPSTPRQPHERRSTTTSMTSIDSGATGFGDDRRFSGMRPSLQDQFKSLRSQSEEHADASDYVLFEGPEDDTPRPNRFTDASPISPVSSTMSYDQSIRSPPLNHSLPPGTAQGVAAGPPREEANVDWNLWQSLVYEGPTALARSSGEDLNKAIASGIPQAIRGVVWQVLAESKNEELEVIYRTLRGRGAGDAEQSSPKASTLTRSESIAVASPNGTIEEETTASTPASTRGRSSNGSTPPTTSPSRSPDANATPAAVEMRNKLMAEKQKREAANIAKLEKMIKRDMGSRTSYSKYVQSAGLQEPLFGVCKAYALFDEGVGYAQGINFIAMPLLFYMAEEEAFTLLVRLMSKYDVRSLFTADMPGLHKRLYQFERLLEDFEPALYCHLKRRNVSPQLYATQWFLTLFTYRFPLQLTTRVYDLIFAEGLTAIFKFALALMQHNRDTLLQMKDMSQLSTFLKEKLFDVYIDKAPSNSSILESSFFGAVTGGVDKEVYKADEMVRDACDIKIPEKDLVQYAAEWEEQQRLERERQEEIERLRHSSTTLTARVRLLEGQTQQQDTEHVTIAGELVRVKVENERLLDENEGLKFKVEELQRMVDLQPAEVEAKLKQEMDRIMQRNIEVQNENRATKEEMDELESELVRMKMAHAETLSEHEALKQKWQGVQAMLK